MCTAGAFLVSAYCKFSPDSKKKQNPIHRRHSLRKKISYANSKHHGSSYNDRRTAENVGVISDRVEGRVWTREMRSTRRPRDNCRLEALALGGRGLEEEETESSICSWQSFPLFFYPQQPTSDTISKGHGWTALANLFFSVRCTCSWVCDRCVSPRFVALRA